VAPESLPHQLAARPMLGRRKAIDFSCEIRRQRDGDRVRWAHSKTRSHSKNAAPTEPRVYQIPADPSQTETPVSALALT
jgi:hypothetical protein